jgi:Transcriptional regulatory protein, C terminal
MPNESSPPLVAATMSGRSRCAGPEFMDEYYIEWRKKFSNSRFFSVHIVRSVAFDHPKEPAQGPLEGEDIETEHWEDARHWMSIYDDLIRFKLGLLQRVKRELPKLHPVAQKAADVDVTFIETQMEGYHRRLDLWYQRVWQLHGLWLDPDGRVLRYQGQEVVLTNREFELLQFLLDHPHRFYTSSQIMGYAWSDSALFPEEVRNYVSRVRKILARLEIPCDLVNRPGRGYSLTFRNEG